MNICKKTCKWCICIGKGTLCNGDKFKDINHYYYHYKPKNLLYGDNRITYSKSFMEKWIFTFLLENKKY